MDGVFINLTENDLILKNGIGEEFTIRSNPDLITPTRQEIQKEDSKLKSVFVDIDNMETKIGITIPMIRSHIKYPFTQDQINKINGFSKGRTRLLILEKKDVEYWSIGRFNCPFRNYRLFTYEGKSLVEYPIPKTYLDVMTDTFDNAFTVGKKIYGKSIGKNIES